MPKRARWIVYGKLDPAMTSIEQHGQLIFMQKRIEGFWLVDWMLRTPPERKAAAVMEAQKRFSEMNGCNRTSYCGAYWGFGFHEDGVASAVEAVKPYGVGL